MPNPGKRIKGKSWEVACAFCGKEFWIHLCRTWSSRRQKKTNRYYCSRECQGRGYAKFHIGRNANSYKTGISLQETYCVDCGKKLAYYTAKRCKNCASKGKNNPSWKGGVSKKSYPTEWKGTLRESIRQRDRHKCQLCGASQAEFTRKLSVHHIDYDKENLDPKNLTTLCVGCNNKVNSNREYWQTHFEI